MFIEQKVHNTLKAQIALIRHQECLLTARNYKIRYLLDYVSKS